MILTVSVLGRYVYFHAKDRYLTSRKFYFSSDVLKTVAPTYRYTNWTGTDTYKIEIELYSFENELRKYDEDLEYTIKCTSFDSSKLNCTIDSLSGPVEKTGIIYASNNKETVTIYVTPKVALYQDQIFTVKIEASTDSPYSKTLSATYELEIKCENKTICVSHTGKTSLVGDIQIFGHEHNQFYFIKNGITYVNPGSVGITLDEGKDKFLQLFKERIVL